MTLAALDPLNAGIVVPKPRIPPVAGERGGFPGTTAASELSRLPVAGGWTIQIGAYADETTAKAELANYAERSTDILGEAARIIAPFQSAEGHVLYRARFGPFAEQKARDVCEALTKRGLTCFAALASR
jgi:D-alanyl-D-alanine carboxypeptidase